MVNIEELSARELYELAKKKELEETRIAQLQEQLSETIAKRDTMVKEYQQGLAYTDRQIEELKAQRQEMVEKHQKALASIEVELKKLRTRCEERKANKTTLPPSIITDSPPAAAPAVSAPPDREDLPPPTVQRTEQRGLETRKKKGEAEELTLLMEQIHKIMKGRTDISESLLREKLNLAKFRPPNLSKLLDALVRQSQLSRKSGGNYVLGKAAKKR